MRKKHKMLRFMFAFFFHFFFASISQSNVIPMDIYFKDFAETTEPRILKFDTNVGYDLLHSVKENQPSPVYLSLSLSIFLSLKSNFLSHISLLL